MTQLLGWTYVGNHTPFPTIFLCSTTLSKSQTVSLATVKILDLVLDCFTGLNNSRSVTLNRIPVQ